MEREVTLEEAKRWLELLAAEIEAETWAKAIEAETERLEHARGWTEKDSLAFKAIHARLNRF